MNRVTAKYQNTNERTLPISPLRPLSHIFARLASISWRGGNKKKALQRLRRLKPITKVGLLFTKFRECNVFLRQLRQEAKCCWLRPRPHVSGYFLIRNFFFPDTNISASTRYVITAYLCRIRPSKRIRIHAGFTEDWQNCPTRHWFVQV